jgi:hypothetical protein
MAAGPRNPHGAGDRGRTASGHGSGAYSETPAGASSTADGNQRPGQQKVTPATLTSWRGKRRP